MNENYEITQYGKRDGEGERKTGVGEQKHAAPEESAVLKAPGIIENPVILALESPASPKEFSALHSALESRLQNSFDFNLAVDPASSNKTGFLLGVCSCVPGEGKTANAFHLALTIARNSFASVCLADLGMADQPANDLARVAGICAPDEEIPGLAGGSGLIDYIQEDCGSVSTLSLSDLPNLIIAPAGKPPRTPARSCRSGRLANLFWQLKEHFSIVLLDMPALSTGYAAPLLKYLDGVLLVVQHNATTFDLAQEAIGRIGKEKIAGIVVNRYKINVPAWIAKRFL